MTPQWSAISQGSGEIWGGVTARLLPTNKHTYLMTRPDFRTDSPSGTGRISQKQRACLTACQSVTQVKRNGNKSKITPRQPHKETKTTIKAGQILRENCNNIFLSVVPFPAWKHLRSERHSRKKKMHVAPNDEPWTPTTHSNQPRVTETALYTRLDNWLFLVLLSKYKAALWSRRISFSKKRHHWQDY